MTYLKNHLPLIIGAIIFVGVIVTYSIHTSRPKPEIITHLPIPEEMKAQVYFDIGQYYFNQDDDPDGPYDLVLARQYFSEVAQLDPKINEQFWYQFGRLEFIEGHLDEALAKFERQIEYFGEKQPNVLYMKGLTYGYKARQTNDPKDWKEAELAFINFLPHAPASPWTRTDLAWVYFSQGKYEEMKPILEEGLTFRPNNPWLLNMYGLALMNTDDPEGALKAFINARAAADVLTEADWGKAYPGNHPDLWGDGLSEFRSIIAKNIETVSSSAQQ